MTNKTTRIVSIAIMAIPALMLTMSAVMKLIHAEQVVQGLTKAGLGNFIMLFGIIELTSVALFIYPKTHKIGFLLLCAYLGGAMSIELAGGQPPMAAIFLTLIWIAVYLKDKTVFTAAVKVEEKK